MYKVLDACAMIAYLRGESGAEVVEALLLEKNNQCLAHAVNLCEVYYDFLRAADESSALAALADLNAAGVATREDMDSKFWQEAGRHKAIIKKISLADCFALAPANRLDVELVTSDHYEFDPVAGIRILQSNVHSLAHRANLSCTAALLFGP